MCDMMRNSENVSAPQVGPYRKCCHVLTRDFEMSRNLGISHSKIYLMYTDQVHFIYKQFSTYIYTASLRPSSFPWKFVLIFIVLSYLSVDTVHNTLLYTVVYGTHSG